MYTKKFASVRSRYSIVREHTIRTTTHRNVDSRSSSPIPIFRQNTASGIRINTNLPPKNATNQRSTAVTTSKPTPAFNQKHHEKIFTTSFIRSEVKCLEKEFRLSESLLSEHLLDYQPEEYDGKTTKCLCCLCKLHNRCGNTDVCIKNHPFDESCTWNQDARPKNNMLKYQKRHVCDECMAALTLNTKKTKAKYFRCHFHPCSIELKSIASLRKHYLNDHLKVKNFICCICEKDYKSRSGLKQHERKH